MLVQSTGCSAFCTFSWMFFHLIFSAGKLPVDLRVPRRKPYFPEVDQKVYERYLARLEKGKPTAVFDIRKIALKVAAKLKIGINEFKASHGWIQSWKKKFRISLRTITKVTRKLEQTEEDKVSVIRIYSIDRVT